jgi:hypothetical protein
MPPYTYALTTHNRFLRVPLLPVGLMLFWVSVGVVVVVVVFVVLCTYVCMYSISIYLYSLL